METSFVVFMNKHGMACASDTDMTLYALSKREPVALAVNPNSPLPWDSIINAYLRQGDIPLHESFSDYANDFAEFLAWFTPKKEWRKLSLHESNILFLGFGTEDFFPSAVDAYVQYDAKQRKMNVKMETELQISDDIGTGHFVLGDFDNMVPMLYGISDPVFKSMVDNSLEVFRSYKERLAVVLKEAGIKVDSDMFKVDDKKMYFEELMGMRENHCMRLDAALDGFNVEDLVTTAETFVDAHDQLEHLKNGGKGTLQKTKELAVITRTEGLVWIKHSLYGL